MNKLNYIWLIVLFILPISFASDSCIINETCYWYAYGTTGETGVNISFRYDNTSLGTYPMIKSGSSYYYNFTYTGAGNVLGCASSYNSTSVINTNCESKNYEYDVEGEFNMLGMILQPFLIFCIGAILFTLGINTRKRSGNFLVMSAGIWYLGYSGLMVYTGSYITAIFFVLVSLAIILISIFDLTAENNE
jgi:hypothetical protein